MPLGVQPRRTALRATAWISALPRDFSGRRLASGFTLPATPPASGMAAGFAVSMVCATDVPAVVVSMACVTVMAGVVEAVASVVVAAVVTAVVVGVAFVAGAPL